MSFIIVIIIIGIIMYYSKSNQNNKTSTITSASTVLNETNTQKRDKEVVVESEYLKSEDQIIEDIIKQELQKSNYDGNDIKAVETKRLRLTIIFSILNFIFIALIFFHLPKYMYLLEVINVWVYLSFMKKYNTIQYIKKELKARPDDEISDIVASIIASGTVNKKRKFIVSISCIVVSILLPLLIFINPIIFYENYEDGYYVRFYATGLTNSETITIPETHNGKKVLGIRGDAFANISSLKEVNLPDTIETIRGKAFKNDKNLKEVELPKNLTYLGGGAFKGCKSLKNITIPEGVTVINGNTFEDCSSLMWIKLHDNITEIHGETFINCTSLTEIDLPPKIREIKGNTFQYCSSLRKIDIPTGVTRIGGHAFEGCSSLIEVKLPSTLREIGSSAFRDCSLLKEIYIPKSVTNIAENAFKGSPTLKRNEINLINKVKIPVTTNNVKNAVTTNRIYNTVNILTQEQINQIEKTKPKSVNKIKNESE